MRDLARLRYRDASARGHVESWFLKANDPCGRRAVWLKWTVWAGERAPARAVAETWAVTFGTSAGPTAAKSITPFRSARFERHGLGVAIDGCTLSVTAARGRVESGGRAIADDLSIAALGHPVGHHAADWMYSPAFPGRKLSSPVSTALVSGQVDIGEEHWALVDWPGMVGHNWGRRHPEAYAWGHCNAWDDGDDLVLEGFTARGSGVIVPAVTMLWARHRGVGYGFDTLISVARNRGAMTPRRWTFRGADREASIEGEMWAETDDMVGLFYPNPDGTMCHGLASMIANAEVTLRLPRLPSRTMRSSRAALEIGTTDARHGVRMYV